MIDVKKKIAGEFAVAADKLKAKVSYIEHHVAHLASAFMVSPFEEAAVVSVDGFGDFVGAMWGIGRGNHLKVKDKIYFPHSLGLFYLAITQLLGFTQLWGRIQGYGPGGLWRSLRIRARCASWSTLRPPAGLNLTCGIFCTRWKGPA